MPLRQRGDRGRGTGHDAPQKRKGSPEPDTLMPPVHGLSALDDLGAEVIGLAEEVAIIAREPVRLVAGFPLGEAVLTFPVLLDVAARALDEMLRELDSPRFGERGRVPLAKVLAHQGEERTKRELDSAMWRCGQKDQVLVLLPRDLAHQLVALMLALVAFRRRGRAMGFIDNHEVGTIEQEEMAVPVALEEVDAGDLYGIIVVDGVRPRLVALQLSDRSGADDDRLKVELLREFPLPLLAERGWAEYSKALDLASIEQLASDEERLDGFPDAHIIGDQHADGLEPERHQQRHELVDAWPDGDLAERAERRRTLAERQARGLPQEVALAASAKSSVLGGGKVAE